MLRRYGISLVVVLVFVVLLAVVLLTQPQNGGSSSNSTNVAADGSTGTPSASQATAQAKLQIINIPANTNVTHLSLLEPSAQVPTPTATATVAQAASLLTVLPTTPTSSANITPTATPYVSLTPGQPRKLDFNYIAPKTTWVVAGDSGFPLDSTQVESEISQLTTLTGISLLPDSATKDLSQYGLDKPSLIITIQTDKSGTKTLDIGNANPITQNYWVKLDGGSQVWTVAPDAISPLLGWFDSPPQAMVNTVPQTAPTSTPGAGTPAATPATVGTPAASSSGTPSVTASVAATTAANASVAATTTTAASTTNAAVTPTP